MDKDALPEILIPQFSSDFKSRRQVVKFTAEELRLLTDFHRRTNEFRKQEGMRKMSLSALIRLIVRKFIMGFTNPKYLIEIDYTLEDKEP